MNNFLNVLIIAGVSLDLFASMEIEGSMLTKVNKKKLFISTTLITLLQIAFYFGGFCATYFLDKYGSIKNTQMVGDIIATVILYLLGGRLIFKAISRKFIHEHLKESTVKQYVKMIVVASLYTIAAGAACGLLESSVILSLIVIVIASVIVCLSGVYVGMYYGYEGRTIVYITGALLLFIAGTDVLMENVLELALI